MFTSCAATHDDYRVEPPFLLQGSYRNMNRIAERVLPVMNEEELETWSAQLNALILVKLAEEDITPNVLRALDEDHARRQQLINQHVPWLLRSTFNEFAGLRGSQFFYGAFARGEKKYKRYVFRKT